MDTDDQPLLTALKRVAVTLDEAGVPYALSGGYASWARGGPASMHDVDFVLAEKDVPKALSVLQEAGLRAEQPPENWLVKVWDADVLVDLIFRPSERPVTPALLDRCDRLNVDSVLMPVVPATELLVHKLLALTEHYCDYAALFPHARALREQVDWAVVRDEVSSSPYARAFLELCAELGVVP